MRENHAFQRSWDTTEKEGESIGYWLQPNGLHPFSVKVRTADPARAVFNHHSGHMSRKGSLSLRSAAAVAILGRVVARSSSGDVDPSSCTASGFLIRTLNVLELHASTLYKSFAILTIDEPNFGVSMRSIASRSVN